MRKATRAGLTLTTVLLLATGCTREQWQTAPGPDDAVALVPWFANMSSDISVKPYHAAPRNPVAGTVPIDGIDPILSLMDLLPTPANLTALGQRFPNPIPSTAASIERGQDRYNIYCTPCHGDGGAGDGPISELVPIFPSLVAERPVSYPDGYLYAILLKGRGIMPEYGSKIHGDDRWHIVNYLRVLQGTAQ
jgi:mono/diheme cytochrome c family protein